MSIGLLGGSFNPPHDGHRYISEIALKRLSLTRLWWLVTPGNPIKSHTELAPQSERMAKSEALARHPRIDITGVEASYPSTYTAETIRRLKQAYPATNFVWIMGADNLRTIHLWRDWQAIFQLVPVVVIDRPEERYRSMASKAAHVFQAGYRDESDAGGLVLLKPPAWTFLTIKPSMLSSTEIRRDMASQSELL